MSTHIFVCFYVALCCIALRRVSTARAPPQQSPAVGANYDAQQGLAGGGRLKKPNEQDEICPLAAQTLQRTSNTAAQTVAADGVTAGTATAAAARGPAYYAACTHTTTTDHAVARAAGPAASAATSVLRLAPVHEAGVAFMRRVAEQDRVDAECKQLQQNDAANTDAVFAHSIAQAPAATATPCVSESNAAGAATRQTTGGARQTGRVTGKVRLVPPSASALSATSSSPQLSSSAHTASSRLQHTSDATLATCLSHVGMSTKEETKREIVDEKEGGAAGKKEVQVKVERDVEEQENENATRLASDISNAAQVSRAEETNTTEAAEDSTAAAAVRAIRAAAEDAIRNISVTTQAAASASSIAAAASAARAAGMQGIRTFHM